MLLPHMTDEEVIQYVLTHEYACYCTPLRMCDGCVINRLGSEVKRLREGRFTPEEIQNLCHNRHPCSREEFEQGCRDYTNKLFGGE
jgi:hypothetical protein